jgi:hypothetical protein
VFPHAFRMNDKWLIPLTDVLAREGDPAETSPVPFHGRSQSIEKLCTSLLWSPGSPGPDVKRRISRPRRGQLKLSCTPLPKRVKLHGGGNSAATDAILSSTAPDDWPRQGVASAITTREFNRWTE